MTSGRLHTGKFELTEDRSFTFKLTLACSLVELLDGDGSDSNHGVPAIIVNGLTDKRLNYTNSIIVNCQLQQ